MEMNWWLLGYWTLGIFCGFGCMVEAKEKGRSGLWFFAGLFFNLLGLLLIAVASNIEEETRLKHSFYELEIAVERLENRLFAEANEVPEVEKKSLDCTGCLEYDARDSFCRRLAEKPTARCGYYWPRKGIENRQASVGDAPA